jgi:exonuclease SbcC
MRPIELKIKGFISYKDEQVIDFTRFNQGIFLIEGDIGAGKTTIFDAMSFALYGEASGSDRGDSKETIEILHCNQLPKSEDTVVELTFSQSGKTYKVERRIHFPKSRIAEGGYGKATVKANLYEGKELLVSDAGKVTAKINEIIGLTKDQFKKIIMLP